MKEFFEELKYMCSASNTKSRGTYIMVVVTLIALLIAFVAGIVAEIVYISAHNFQILPLAISVVALVIEVALVIWLKKS